MFSLGDIREGIELATEKGHERNEEVRGSIAMYCERIVRALSRTNQDVVTVDRHSHHYQLEIHRDNGGNIVSIDVIRARHSHHGMKLTCSIIRDGDAWTAKSAAVDPLKYERMRKRISRIANVLEGD